jgi:hypothetical protein
LFVRNKEYKKNKTRFNIANDSRFYSSKSRMIREYDSINIRLGQPSLIFFGKIDVLELVWSF